jgi:hypoxanthine-DNA glycosylase
MENSIKSRSFAPIIYSDTKILILGSLPGKKSLELEQYYGHARNRIWKIMSHLTSGDIPITYQQKKEMLCKNKIGLWDVAHSAQREGSLDSNIKDESPNDIERILDNYSSIKVIGFNGKKSEKMFYKYFIEKPEFKYVPLPSTSPANMAISFEDICARWSQLFA